MGCKRRSHPLVDLLERVADKITAVVLFHKGNEHKPAWIDVPTYDHLWLPELACVRFVVPHILADRLDLVDARIQFVTWITEEDNEVRAVVTNFVSLCVTPELTQNQLSHLRYPAILLCASHARQPVLYYCARS